VNSIDNFARSWQRAAGFYEITPVRPSFRLADDDEIPTGGFDEEDGGNMDNTPKGHRSMLRHALRSGQTAGDDDAIDDDVSVAPTENDTLLGRDRSSHPQDENIFTIEPSLQSPFGGSYGSTWGSLSARVNESSMRHAGRLFRQQQQRTVNAAIAGAAPAQDDDKANAPLLIRQIEEEDGKVVNVVVGQSTLPQTVCNSVNTLIGVGILALPLAMNYSGWVLGILFFCFAALTTCYTAKLLAKCADVDGSLITFADLAFVSFGPWARVGVSILFILELLGACVALVVLFADSLSALLPSAGLTLDAWKMLFGVILVPLCFVPLRWLSYTSILGIVACLGIVLAVISDGLIQPAGQPGSLWQPAPTHLFPQHWAALPISWGIMMAPWGGHSVFPNIYRDMRHPYKYHKAVNVSYSFTFTLDLAMAVAGFLMFGTNVKDEITRNILLATAGGPDPVTGVVSSGYPPALSAVIVVALAVIPLTKAPLNARPIYSTLELTLGLSPQAMGIAPGTHGLGGLTRGLLRLFVRAACCATFVVVAILIPDFDRLMSLIGSLACFAICLILPCAFHLRLFGKELSPWRKTGDWALITVSTVLAVVSVGFTCAPREALGLD
jgi:vesicular inhibitory amino acid transporter